jgi:hypothetical protein
MDTLTDLKGLWKKQEVNAAPEIKELSSKATSVTRNILFRLFVSGAAIACLTAYFVHTLMSSTELEIMTRIGMTLVVMAMVAYLISANSLLNLLLKTDYSWDSNAFLNKLIVINKKQEFIYKKLVIGYMAALLLGFILCMPQYSRGLTLAHQMLQIAEVVACILVAWFVFRPRELKKQRQIAEIINKLQSIQSQLSNNA